MIFMNSVRFNIPCLLFLVKVVPKPTRYHMTHKNRHSLLLLPARPLCISIHHICVHVNMQGVFSNK